MNEKRCVGCAETKPLEAFAANKRTKDGKQVYCRACCSALNRIRFEENHEEILAKQRARCEANREAVREASRLSYHKHREKRRELAKANYAANAEKIKAEVHAYREANREKVRQQQRDSYYANWDKNREWRQANKEYIRVNSANRRAQLRENGGRFTKKQWREKGEALGWKCYLCDEQLAPGTAVIEHVLPIARGGTNNIDNIMPACAHCNHRKADRTLDEFLNDETYVRGPKKKRKRAA